MRSLKFLCAALLLALPGAASANNISTEGLVNWTHTWIEFGQSDDCGDLSSCFFVSAFDFDQASEYDLVDIGSPDGRPIVLQDFVTFGSATVGAIVEIVIPNFFDPLPTKLIEIVFQGGNTSDEPEVLDIIGADAPFSGPPGPAKPVLGQPDFSKDPFQFCGEFSCTEYWILHPNPDFETVKVFIPTAFEFESMHIVTQSVPEPTTWGLLGVGLAGIGAMGRRRRG